ncbi:hypothetical protein [Chlorogloeopsis fritschii]|uniref:hypothetical protein n=1 Tax=Chlorogloeopsis fritschii TaxID=1124 RepID=UPI0023F0F9DE|nr:hypothetical protein [Chlorogloeopsis fritschii]
MGFLVEAWFHNSVAETVLGLLYSGLTAAGFAGVSTIILQTISWDCVSLDQHKVFVAISPRTEDHIVVTVEARVDWSAGYSAF